MTTQSTAAPSSLSLQVETDVIVKSYLESLVKHFSQPIHQQQQQVLEKNQAPHFDDLLGRPSPASPVTKHIIDSLQAHRNVNNVILKWMEGYCQFVQPSVLLDSHGKLISTGISVLSQYEVVLSTLLKDYDKKESRSELQDVASNTVVLLARDVSSLTESTCTTDSQFVMSTLLHIMARCIPLFHSNDKSAMTTCAVTLLAFGDSINVRSLIRIQDYTTVSFRDIVSYNVGTDWIDDWEMARLDSSAWNDAVSGIVSRAAKSCWNALDVVLAQDATAVHSDQRNKDNNQTATTTNDIAGDAVPRRVLQHLGWTNMAISVRAHFYGRDVIDATTIVSKKQTWQYPLPQKPQESPTASIERRPSRVFVAIRYIFFLQEKPLTINVLQEILPMVYTLLDSTPNHVTIGAAALIHVLSLVSSHELHEFQEMSRQVLERSLATTARKGPAIFLLSVAQSRVYQLLLETNETVTVQRRRATQQILTTIYRNASQTTLIQSLLVGGLVPLLQQLSMEPNASAMELGRLGLTTLLSVLNTTFLDSNICGATLVALMHLMMGAHPILPRHGGQVMSQLLASFCRRAEYCGDDDKWDDLERVQTATAAMALLVCGERAEVVLNEVEKHSNDYDDILVKQVSNVRTEASRLQEMNEP
jgi:hypothetical protein